MGPGARKTVMHFKPQYQPRKHVILVRVSIEAFGHDWGYAKTDWSLRTRKTVAAVHDLSKPIGYQAFSIRSQSLGEVRGIMAHKKLATCSIHVLIEARHRSRKTWS